MTGGEDPPRTVDPGWDWRLASDLDDLRFENARLKRSIAERQAEIVALSERLAGLQARLESLHRVTAWSAVLRRLRPMRMLLRRR